MASWIATLVLAFLLPLTLPAKDKPLQPIGFPPHVGIGKAIEQDGKPLIELATASLIPETVTTFEEREGRQIREVTTQYKTLIVKSCFFVHERDAIAFDQNGKSIKSAIATGLEGVKVLYKSGKVVPRDELPKLFAKARPVIVFGGNDADPYYLQVLHDDVLIVTGAANLVFPTNEHAPGKDSGLGTKGRQGEMRE